MINVNGRSGVCFAPLRRRTVISLALLLVFGTVYTAGWINGEKLLRGAAMIWIDSDPEGPADAAIVLGGGISTRPFAATGYYRSGLVDKVLVSNVRPTNRQWSSVPPSSADLDCTISILLKLGVPRAKLEYLDVDVANTYREAVAVRQWALRTPARGVIVPTEVFSTRRVRWVFELCKLS